MKICKIEPGGVYKLRLFYEGVLKDFLTTKYAKKAQSAQSYHNVIQSFASFV
jgi:hypothetical protein